MNPGTAMERTTLVLLTLPPGIPPEWAPRMEGMVVTGETGDDRALQELLGSAGAAVIDGEVEDPVHLARRIRRLAPDVQLVFVTEPEGAARLRRSMRFVPGLGEPWIVDPDDDVDEALQRAVRVSSQRAAHADRLERLSERVSAIHSGSRPRVMPDRYLATLLEILPDPVIALDDEDRILFANSSAEGLLGGDPVEPGDRIRLQGAVSSGGEEGLEELLRRGADGPASGELVVEGSGGERIYDVAVAPVRGERPVRLLVLHDVTEREHLLEERDRALHGLREAMQHRSRFYASMSHELRTPINALFGYVDLLLEGIHGDIPPGQEEALQRLGRAAHHLRELVDDVLDLSRVESGKLAVTPEDVSVPELLEDLDATMDPFARSSRTELRFHLDPSCRTLRTDPKRLRQILMNLLSNAIRFGGGEPVDVRCTNDDENLVVEVEDHGPGIPRDDRERIFEEFVQLGPDDGGGTGLGLAIARSLARLLGGDVTVSSRPGQGSTFTLTLPLEGDGTSTDPRGGRPPRPGTRGG